MQLDPNFNGLFLLSVYFVQRKRFKCILNRDLKKNDSCPNNCENKELDPESPPHSDRHTKTFMPV